MGGAGEPARFSAVGKYSDCWEVFDFIWCMGGEPGADVWDRGCSSVLDFDCDGGFGHSASHSTDGTIDPA